MGAGFGFLSPFDLVHTLTTVSEIFSQAFMLYSLSAKGISYTHAIAIVSVFLPSVLSFISSHCCPDDTWPHALFGEEERLISERHEQMRHLAYSDTFKAEIMLFGLSDWILKTWVETRKSLLGFEAPSRSTTAAMREFAHSSVVEVVTMLQNVRITRLPTPLNISTFL